MFDTLKSRIYQGEQFIENSLEVFRLLRMQNVLIVRNV